jgi:hypothetical protein
MSTTRRAATICGTVMLAAWLSGLLSTARADVLVEPLAVPADPFAFDRRYTGELPDWMNYYTDHYHKFSYHHGAYGTHHGRSFWYREGRHHGFPFAHTYYQPRFPGRTYTFEHWGPRRSWYYPWSPGAHYRPYGHSPEPYYEH